MNHELNCHHNCSHILQQMLNTCFPSCTLGFAMDRSPDGSLRGELASGSDVSESTTPQEPATPECQPGRSNATLTPVKRNRDGTTNHPESVQRSPGSAGGIYSIDSVSGTIHTDASSSGEGVVQEDEQARQIRVAQFRDQRQRFVELVASRIVSQGMGSRNTTRKPAAAKLQARTKAPAKKPAQKKPAQMKKPASKASKGMIGKKKPASQHS